MSQADISRRYVCAKALGQEGVAMLQNSYKARVAGTGRR